MSGVRTIADLMERCYVEEATGCWHWRGAEHNGCPKVWLPALGRTCGGPFAALYLSGKQMPKGKRVYRKCCTELCVRPDHQTLLTAAEWGRKRASMGHMRYEPGWQASVRLANQSRPSNKLNLEAVRQIRQMPGTLLEIAAQFGVSRSQVQRIRAGKAWTNEVVSNASVFTFGKEAA